MASLTAFVGIIDQAFAAAADPSCPLLLTVAGCATTGLALYALTRGREFLVFGYSSAVFLIPFVQWH